MLLAPPPPPPSRRRAADVAALGRPHPVWRVLARPGVASRHHTTGHAPRRVGGEHEGVRTRSHSISRQLLFSSIHRRPAMTQASERFGGATSARWRRTACGAVWGDVVRCHTWRDLCVWGGSNRLGRDCRMPNDDDSTRNLRDAGPVVCHMCNPSEFRDVAISFFILGVPE